MKNLAVILPYYKCTVSFLQLFHIELYLTVTEMYHTVTVLYRTVLKYTILYCTIP